MESVGVGDKTLFTNIPPVITPPSPTHGPGTPTVSSGLKRFAAQFISSGGVVRPFAVQVADAFVERLRALSGWLEACNFIFTASEIEAQLAAWLGVIGVRDAAPETFAGTLVARAEWRTLRVKVGDSVLAQTLVRENVAELQELCRWMLVIGYVERIVGLAAADIDALEARRYLRDRIIVLPKAFKAEQVNFLGNGALMVRQPAFTDLAVVREEWSCFVPGEIAHIENVLKGERKTREHVRTDETTTSESTDTERTQLDERDAQTSERSTLQEEASKQTSLQVGLQGQVDVNASYGPVQVETSFGASLSYSTDESRRKASETSREVVNRSISRISETVTQKRATVTLNRIVETNSHMIENSASPTGNVVGIYRWVDKVSRMQVFTYPHRFVLEFQIPEPASYVRWLERIKPPVKVDIAPAPDFVDDRGLALTADSITRENYLKLAAKFKATGVLPPPAATINISGGGDVAVDADKLPASQDTPLEFAPAAVAKIDLVVPPDYNATTAVVAVAAVPLLARWRDLEVEDAPSDSSVNYYIPNTLGYHEIVASVTFGGQKKVMPVATDTTPTVRESQERAGFDRPTGYRNREAWWEYQTTLQDAAGMGSGQVRADVIVNGALRATASVNLTCTLTTTALQQWKIDTFDRLSDAQQTWQRRYQEAVNAKEVESGVTISGRSPEANKITVREEVKRQVIELMLGREFDGLDLVTIPSDDATPALGPTNKLKQSVEAAALVQFIEQVFEWSNMTFIMYPYYWAARQRWAELQPIEGTDPEYVEFLRAGSARVVVPARPGFENDVLAFTAHGIPWSGGPVPLADDDDGYVSVAQEIQDLRGAPDEGVPGDLWEVKQPTTLVWLDDDSQLPKRNERRQLVGTPLIDLCGA